MAERRLQTRSAELAVEDTGGRGPPVLMIHGNSASKRMFAQQFESSLAERFRLVAFDLPGHGASTDAADPASAYTVGGYAQAALEVLAALGVERAAVFGWSLGGHVALHLVERFRGMTGLMICGTPPLPADPAAAALGFRPTPTMALTGAADWSQADAEAYARAGAAPFAAFMLTDAQRTDGRARATMMADAMAGGFGDQQKIAETAKIPLAIVNGADDAFVNVGFFDQIAYANLWDGRVHSLAGCGHAPFWQAPERFNPLFERFLTEMGSR